MVRSGIGDAPKRREDQRFLTGQGRYLDDLAFDRLTHAVVLRATHAHAEIHGIDTAAATTMPGILAVLTAADARADGLKPLLPYVEANTQTGDPFAFVPQPLLADDKVRYVGEPVALIVAETRDQALDAAERVLVEYLPLPSAILLGTAIAARRICAVKPYTSSLGKLWLHDKFLLPIPSLFAKPEGLYIFPTFAVLPDEAPNHTAMAAAFHSL